MTNPGGHAALVYLSFIIGHWSLVISSSRQVGTPVPELKCSEDEAADVDGGEQAHDVGEDPRRHGMTRLLDPDRAEVYGQDVEGRFGARIGRRGEPRDERVGTMGLDQFGHDPERAAPGKGTQDRQGEDL